jgi:hypothetical protein
VACYRCTRPGSQTINRDLGFAIMTVAPEFGMPASTPCSKGVVSERTGMSGTRRSMRMLPPAEGMLCHLMAGPRPKRMRVVVTT